MFGSEFPVEPAQIEPEPGSQPVEQFPGCGCFVETQDMTEIRQREANAIGLPEEPLARQLEPPCVFAAQRAVLFRQVKQDGVRLHQRFTIVDQHRDLAVPAGRLEICGSLFEWLEYVHPAVLERKPGELQSQRDLVGMPGFGVSVENDHGGNGDRFIYSEGESERSSVHPRK